MASETTFKNILEKLQRFSSDVFSNPDSIEADEAAILLQALTEAEINVGMARQHVARGVEYYQATTSQLNIIEAYLTRIKDRGHAASDN